MIVCPNCNHQNPEGATQCEACYTPLPTTTSCPNCGANVQTDATFCGQCGFNLQQAESNNGSSYIPETIVNTPETMESVNQEPDKTAASPTIPLMGNSGPIEPVTLPTMGAMSNSFTENPPIEPISSSPEEEEPPPPPVIEPIESTPEEEEPPPPVIEKLNIPDSQPEIYFTSKSVSSPEPEISLTSKSVSPPEPEISLTSKSVSPPEPEITSPPAKSTKGSGASAATQLQIQSARLFHVQTNQNIEIPQNLSVIHMGKPNERIPPDIDVSGFPNSEIVSRIHADIRVEGDAFYIEDVGSANGTYINHTPLLTGNRHRLRGGDRIAFGKGDKVTFIFQMS